jgi:hypothetical protein
MASRAEIPAGAEVGQEGIFSDSGATFASNVKLQCPFNQLIVQVLFCPSPSCFRCQALAKLHVMLPARGRGAAVQQLSLLYAIVVIAMRTARTLKPLSPILRHMPCAPAIQGARIEGRQLHLSNKDRSRPARDKGILQAAGALTQCFIRTYLCGALVASVTKERAIKSYEAWLLLITQRPAGARLKRQRICVWSRHAL